MNRAKRKQVERSRLTILSLSISLWTLGIGCVLWAGINIWTQSGFSGKYSAGAEFDYQASPSKSRSGDSSPYGLPIFLYPTGLFAGLEPGPISEGSYAVVAGIAQPLYPDHPEKGETIGTLRIPAIKMKLPIIEGTRERELERGVGHFIGSVLPGQNDNCVLSGHRDTVFRNLGKLQKGDSLVVTTSAGRFIYKIRETRIVDKDDKTVIVPTKGAVLTLTTCYPFYFIGHAPDRYVISADLEK